ncbi:MAG: divalent-cation tolerance protein CutA [Gemmatimonadetes bacterium]|nr:MAG: divalent-cation tolerance protein CutA [Gemmatimonadota bacterium]
MTGDDTGVRLVLVTTPDRETAESLARTLVEERLAACGNVVPGLRSIFRWEGEVQAEDEALLLLKTRVEHVERVGRRVAELHPYDVPEVVALPVCAGLGAYLDWVRFETRAEPGVADG